MSPAYAYGRGGTLYRYYVTASLQQGGRRERDDEAPRRVSAAALEARLLDILGRLFYSPPERRGLEARRIAQPTKPPVNRGVPTMGETT